MRTRQVAFVVDGLLTVEGTIEARGKAVSSDQVGPDGGTISLTAQDIEIVGTGFCVP